MKFGAEDGYRVAWAPESLETLVTLLSVVEPRAEPADGDVGVGNKRWGRPLPRGLVVPNFYVTIDLKVKPETQLGPIWKEVSKPVILSLGGEWLTDACFGCRCGHSAISNEQDWIKSRYWPVGRLENKEGRF